MIQRYELFLEEREFVDEAWIGIHPSGDFVRYEDLPRWRPVSEKPPIARRVLLCDGEVYEGFWGGDEWNAVGGLEPVVHPTHWMDLDDLLNLERP